MKASVKSTEETNLLLVVSCAPALPGRKQHKCSSGSSERLYESNMDSVTVGTLKDYLFIYWYYVLTLVSAHLGRRV